MTRPDRKPIEQVISEAGYDPGKFSEHDRGELAGFREFLRIRRAGRQLIREGKTEEGKAMIARAIALAAAEPRPVMTEGREPPCA